MAIEDKVDFYSGWRQVPFAGYLKSCYYSQAHNNAVNLQGMGINWQEAGNSPLTLLSER
jgi:hypothetical protein